MNYKNFKSRQSNFKRNTENNSKSFQMDDKLKNKLGNKNDIVWRSKSPALFSKKNKNLEELAAGVPRMNSTLYSVPRKGSSKNPVFKHPSLVSNIVFYSTNFNAKNKVKDQYVTTNSLMHSQVKRSTSPYDSEHRSFMVNGHVAERLTRLNTSNCKNSSTFQLWYSKKELDNSMDGSRPRDKSFVKEVTNIPQSSVNIWKYKDSPFGK